MGPKVALSAPEPGLAVGQADCVVAALLEKRSALAADLAVAEDTVSQLRRQIMALSETLPCWRCSPSSPSGPMISLDATASIPGPLPGIPSNT